MKKPLIALVVALGLLGTGCTGSGAGDRGDRPGQRPVRFLVFGAPEELAAYRALGQAYEKATPGTDVQLVEASDRDDLIARLSTSIAGGSPPDVFLLNYRYYGQFAGRGAIEPIEDRLRTSSVISPDDFYPAPMEAFRWQGRQLCLPTNVSSLVVYYNRDLFDRYGVAPPKAGWNWSDLTTTARALTRTAGGQPVRGGEAEGGAARPALYGLAIEPTIIRLAPFVWSNGGDIVDDPLRPTRFTLDTPQAEQALRGIVDLRLAYGVVPTDDEVEAEDDESRFLNGRVAMLLSSRRFTTTLRAGARFGWDIAPVPTYGRPAGILHSDAFCIPRGSKAKDAAWRFVEYASSPAGQRVLAGTGRTVPSNIEVSRSPAFLDPARPPRNAQVFLDTVPTIRRVPTISTWPEIEDIVDGILENAMYRGDRIDDVVREIDRRTRPLFARAQAP